MFETSNEALKFLNKLGYFICKFERGTMKKPMVCKKTSKDSFVEIQGVESFTEKINNNTILVDKNAPILNTIEIGIFKEYDEIEKDNEQQQKLRKQIIKNSKPILQVKKGVLARGYGQDFYVIDIDTFEAVPIGKELISVEEVKYNKQTVINALRNDGVNKVKQNYQRQLKLWKSIGK